MEYLFAHTLHDGDGGFRDFRFAELDALASMYNAPTPVIQSINQNQPSPFVLGTLPSDKIAVAICKRSIILKSISECYGHGDSIEACIESVKKCPIDRLMPFINENQSISVSVQCFGRTLSPPEQRELIDKFSFLPVKAKVDLSSPNSHKFAILVDFGDSRLSGFMKSREPIHVYFSREVAHCGKLAHIYRLTARPFIGPTSMPADIAFVMANQAQVTSTSVCFDPFVGTGSLMIACAHWGATVFGIDLDWRLLHGKTKGGRATATDSDPKYTVFDNFKHYNLRKPEILCADQSHPVWQRAEIFDAIVTDPPYGIRAGARKSGRKGEVRPVGVLQDGVPSSTVHIPPTQLYEVEDVIHDLLDVAARTLKMNGRLVYVLPTSNDFTDEELPQHPCMKVITCSKQSIRSAFMRRFITMQKVAEWQPYLNMIRRNKITEPTPKYANIKNLLAADPPAPVKKPSNKSSDSDDQMVESETGLLDVSKRKQRKNERHAMRMAHHKRLKTDKYSCDTDDTFLLYNGYIYPSFNQYETEPPKPHSWVIIKGGKVLEVGESVTAPVKTFPESQRINLERQTVLPGLIDSHIHVMLTGKSKFTIDLSTCDSIESMKQAISRRAESDRTSAAPTGENDWLLANAWDHTLYGRYPTKQDLDEACSDRPLFALRGCYHIAVVNSRALKLAGLDRNSTDPSGGTYDRDEHGELTGMLRENAVSTVQSLIVESRDRVKSYLERGLSECVNNGLTAVQTNDERVFDLYRELADEGKLKCRAFVTIGATELNDHPSLTPESLKHGPLLECHRVKLFVDGALGSETAALSQPYPHRCAHNHPHSHNGQAKENFGILIHSPESLTKSIRQAHSMGFRVECHAIGDRAAATVINSCREIGLTPTDRPIITHCQVMTESLIDAMSELGAIADIQPQFVTTDCRWIEQRIVGQLQSSENKFALYAWRTMIEKNVMCAGGSDSPVEMPSPLLGMHAAVFRPRTQYVELLKQREKLVDLIDRAADAEQELSEVYGGCWLPEQTLTVSQALALYTANGAFTVGHEDKLGRIERGFDADFTVVDRNVVTQPHSLVTAQVTQVWVAGQRIK